MFSWFFKQLYFIFKRLTKHKFLLLFAFFILAILLFNIKANAFEYVSGNDNYHVSVEDFPSNALTYFYNYSSFNPDVHDFICYRNTLADGTSTYAISYFTKNSSKKMYISALNKYTNANQNFMTIQFNSSTSFTNYVFSYTGSYTRQSSNSASTITAYSQVWSTSKLDSTFVFYSSLPLYLNNSYTDIAIYPYNLSGDPYITNDNNSIIDFSFSTLNINAGSLSIDNTYNLKFTYPDSNNSYVLSIDNYKAIDGQNLIFNIPRSLITNSIIVRSGSFITYSLLEDVVIGAGNIQTNTYNLGSYTLNLTTEQEDIINSDSQRDLINDLSNNQQATTDAVDNLTNTLTDDNFDDDSIDLPTFEFNDITQVGINDIFHLFYDAFCTGNSADIVFPIPFTNKSFTLPANYTYNMLYNNGGNVLIVIIKGFWSYKIGSYIIHDIWRKITKIQKGNIEDIQKDNIKGEML